jgi:hypothetical protein
LPDSQEPFADKTPEERHRILKAALAAGIFWLWDSSRRRYINVRIGRVVQEASVNRLLREIGEGARERMQSLTAKMSLGQISNAEWQLGMLDEIKNSHRALAELAKGGKEMMTARDWGLLGARVRQQNQYFLGFASDVITGQMSEAQVVNRAGLYADALYSTYQNTVALRERGAGVRLARRVLDAGAQHCEDCPPLAALDWIPIEEMTPIGDTPCQVQCRCTIEYQTEVEAPPAEEQPAAAGPGFHVVIE